MVKIVIYSIYIICKKIALEHLQTLFCVKHLQKNKNIIEIVIVELYVEGETKVRDKSPELTSSYL